MKKRQLSLGDREKVNLPARCINQYNVTVFQRSTHSSGLEFTRSLSKTIRRSRAAMRDPKLRARFDGRFIDEPKSPRWRAPFGSKDAYRTEFLRPWRNRLETWSR
jgi:hypothetical protein